ncbi:hypothetical protein Y1Q_0009968 [Alligator mississippiensis]|uniref:Uncharacterized protein n=1 Tax=Alligator mississippiensis TaxID=8496 RepID=A0A151MXF4_ALLMI|nr:hypothetical protein Y1Q_0009968 [Alligator mississippiensis]
MRERLPGRFEAACARKIEKHGRMRMRTSAAYVTLTSKSWIVAILSGSRIGEGGAKCSKSSPRVKAQGLKIPLKT